MSEEAKSKRVSRARQRRRRRPPIIDENQWYSVDEAAAAREQSRAAFYVDVGNGVLKTHKRGKRTVVLGAEIIRANRAEASP